MSEIFDRLQQAWANLRLGVRVILLLLGVGLTLVLLARPLRAVVRAIALDRNSRLAEAALQAGVPHESRSRSLAAIQSAPDRVDLVRLLLKSMNLLNDPKRVPVANLLLAHLAATAADKRLALATLADHAPLHHVGAAWVTLSPAEQAMPGMIDIFARRLMAEGKSAEATRLLKDLDFNNPPDSVIRLLVDLLASRGSRDAWDECQKLLILRAKSATADGQPVPDECLAGWEQVPTEFLKLQALESLPATGPPRLMMLRRRLSQGATALDLEDPEIAGWLRHTAPADRLPLAILLAGGGRLASAFELLDKGPALTPDEFEWLRATCLRTQDWPSWRKFLKSPAVAEIRQAWVKADLALVHFQLKEAEESKTAWNEALRLAANSAQTPRLTDLSRRVHPWMPEQSREALLTAIRTPGEALPLFNDLDELMVALRTAKRDKDLLDVCRIYRGVEPSNPVAMTRFAYLALLAGELSPAAATQLVEPVIHNERRSPHPRMVAILAALLQGDRSAARGWIARDAVAWDNTPPFYQWLVARAETPAETLPRPDAEALLPSENAIIPQLR